MRDVFDLLASQSDAQTLGHEAHQSRLEVGILQNFGREIRRTAKFRKPFAEDGMSFFRHANKKHGFEIREIDPGFFGQWMLLRDGDDRLLAGDHFQLQVPNRGWRPKPNESKIDLARLEGPELFP